MTGLDLRHGFLTGPPAPPSIHNDPSVCIILAISLSYTRSKALVKLQERKEKGMKKSTFGSPQISVHLKPYSILRLCLHSFACLLGYFRPRLVGAVVP